LLGAESELGQLGQNRGVGFGVSVFEIGVSGAFDFELIGELLLGEVLGDSPVFELVGDGLVCHGVILPEKTCHHLTKIVDIDILVLDMDKFSLDIDKTLVWSAELEEYVRRAVRTWGFRLGVRGEDVRDLEQDAVIVAWEKVENGKVRYREGLWFIARNAVLDFRARRGRAELCALDESVLPALGSSGVLDKLVVEAIAAEFPELVMLASARADGFEWDLIAESLGVSSGTLRVRYSRMVKKAAEFFGEEVLDLLG
jgi:DNA-directed RNA polymerase specialized sigma24 family protein